MSGVTVWDLCECGGKKDSRAVRCAYCAYDPEVRFWRNVTRTSGCWIWHGYKHSQGYGRLRVGGRKVLAHRFAYELLIGPIPEGTTLDHLCENPACVNPAHLEPVTQGENMRRWREHYVASGGLLFGGVPGRRRRVAA